MKLEELKIQCPNCENRTIISNGTPGKKGNGIYKQWICKDCGKNFTYFTLAEIPRTKYPFWFILYMLDFKQKAKIGAGRKEMKDIKHLRRVINFYWFLYYYIKKFESDSTFADIKLKLIIKYGLGILENTSNSDNHYKHWISRQTIHHWIDNYSTYLNDEELLKEAKIIFQEEIWDTIQKHNNIRKGKLVSIPVEKYSFERELPTIKVYKKMKRILEINDQELREMKKKYPWFFNEIYNDLKTDKTIKTTISYKKERILNVGEIEKPLKKSEIKNKRLLLLKRNNFKFQTNQKKLRNHYSLLMINVNINPNILQINRNKSNYI